MDTTTIRPALDFSKMARLKDRLQAAGMLTDEERLAFHRMLMFYGRHAMRSLE